MWYVFFYIFIDIVLLSKMSQQPAILPLSVHNFAACLTFRFNYDRQKQHKLTQIKVLPPATIQCSYPAYHWKTFWLDWYFRQYVFYIKTIYKVLLILLEIMIGGMWALPILELMQWQIQVKHSIAIDCAFIQDTFYIHVYNHEFIAL